MVSSETCWLCCLDLVRHARWTTAAVANSHCRGCVVVLRSVAVPGRRDADLNGIEATQSVVLCNGMEVVETTATVTVAPAHVRVAGYEAFPGLGLYKLHARAVPWDEAWAACQAEGALLLAPASEAEAQAVRHLLGRKTAAGVEGATWSGWAWAGFHDRGVEGDYLTLAGGRLNESGYAKWHPGQPDNKPWGIEPDQDCGSINKDGLLNDLPCTGKLPFICKKPI